MKFCMVIFFLLVVVCGPLLSRQTWQEAPEKWSKPVKIRELSVGTHPYAAEPSLTPDEKTIYYYHYSDTARGGIYVATLQGNSWSPPVRLSENVNQNLAEGPSISPDGKRLYFRMYGRFDGFGGWDLYYSDWDSATKDWGPAKNLGPNINRGDVDEWSAMTPDNKHLYWTRYPGSIRLSTWNDSSQTWSPSEWLSYLLGILGRAAATRDLRKVYYDPFVGTSNPHDIYVNYYDTLKKDWSYPMVLNINKMMDTATSARGKIQYAPWISADGRTLYFTSDHDSSVDIWMSKLLIDENGNPVSVENESHQVPIDLELLQNYPNPFNPLTIIEYEISVRGYVELKIFDTLGREIITLVNQEQVSGKYRVSWNGKDKNNVQVSSGVYFYTIQNKGNRVSKKMIMIH